MGVLLLCRDAVSAFYCPSRLSKFYFKQFSLARVQFMSISPIGRTLAGATFWATSEQWLWRGTPNYQKLHHYWSCTSRLLSFKKPGHSLPVVLFLCKFAVSVFFRPGQLRHRPFLNVKSVLFRTIQFKIRTGFVYTVKRKNRSILSNSV